MIVTTISLRNTGELTEWTGARFFLYSAGREVHDTGWVGSIQLDPNQEYTFDIPAIEADVAVCRVYDIDYPGIQVVVNGNPIYELPTNNDILHPEHPTQTECETAGYYWYWSQCHETSNPLVDYNIPLTAPPPPECAIDSDCVAIHGPNFVCIDGVCVYQEPPPPPPPDGGPIGWWNSLAWWQKCIVVGSGVGAVGGAIYFVLKKRK